MMETFEEYAWAAGLFEGEGCVYKHLGKLTLQIRMTDRDVLDRFARVIGAGKVYGPYVTKQGGGKINPTWKPNYLWTARGRPAQTCFLKIGYWLGERRTTKALEVLDACL